MKKSPKERVEAQLTLAREIAWDAFHEPSEETVMAVFRQICIETELAQVEPVEMPGAVVH